MLKGMRLKVMVIAGIMLAFLWSSSFNELRGAELCPL